MEVVNTKVMSHPMNWVIVWLMVLIAGLFGHFALAAVGVNPAAKK